jgi:hypothetical protein
MTYPGAMFQTQNGVCALKSATVALGAGNNQSIVAAVTTKRIQVVGLWAFTATGTFNIKNGSGGATLLFGPVAAATPVFALPLDAIGYFETSVNTALVADVFTAAVNIFVRYIEIE